MVWVSNQGRKVISLFLKRSDRVWGPAGLLCNGYRGSFLKVKSPGSDVDCSPPPSVQAMSEQSYKSTPPIRLSDVKRSLSFTTYNQHVRKNSFLIVQQNYSFKSVLGLYSVSTGKYLMTSISFITKKLHKIFNQFTYNRRLLRHVSAVHLRRRLIQHVFAVHIYRILLQHIVQFFW